MSERSIDYLRKKRINDQILAAAKASPTPKQKAKENFLKARKKARGG